MTPAAQLIEVTGLSILWRKYSRRRRLESRRKVV